MRNKACISVEDARCRGLRAARNGARGSAIDEMFSPLFSILGKRSLLVDTEQAPQFRFRSEQVLKGVLIEFLKKGLDSLSHCRA